MPKIIVVGFAKLRFGFQTNPRNLIDVALGIIRPHDLAQQRMTFRFELRVVTRTQNLVVTHEDAEERHMHANTCKLRNLPFDSLFNALLRVRMRGLEPPRPCGH